MKLPLINEQASRAVAQFCHTFLLCAVVAAEHHAALLHPVAYYPHPAMPAGGRERLDSTFKAIERVGFI